MGVSGGGSARTRCCPLVGTAADSGERGDMGESACGPNPWPLLLSGYVKTASGVDVAGTLRYVLAICVT